MQKIVSFILGVMLMGQTALMPVAAMAQTTGSTASVDAMIAQLEAQMATLKTQIEALRAARVQVASTTAQTIALVRQLRLGMSGDDVRLLQILLASDRDIFPEGQITGFFGKNTEKALRKFQRKHGLSQVGRAGPQTLEELRRLLRDTNLSEEDDDDHDDDDDDNNSRGKRLCVKVTAGWTIPEGWTRKDSDDNKQLIKVCRNQTTTPPPPATPPPPTTPPPPAADTSAPVVTALVSTSTTATGSTIKWTTDEFSPSILWYGIATPSTNVTNNVTTKTHSVTLTGLSASTTYQYRVVAKDSAGNIATSSQQSFLTL